MLPKAKSVTTSSKSSTNNSADRPSSEIDTPVQFIKGVGPKLGAIFKNRGIETVKDALYFFPRHYEDRTKFLPIKQLVEGANATISAKITGMRKIPTRGYGKSLLEVRIEDAAGGTMALKWFHAPRGMEARFQPGVEIIATGAVKQFMGRFEMIHPELTFNASHPDTEGASESGNHNFGRIVPIYTEIEGVSTRILRKVLWESIQKFSGNLVEDLPERLLAKHKLPPLSQAIRTIHFPPDPKNNDSPEIIDLLEFRSPVHWRLIYDEFLKFEYLVLRKRLRMEKELAPALGKHGGFAAAEALEKLLPFQLTGDQKKSIAEILKDLSESHPMNRLIQGDVGSGKTAVAFLTAGFVIAEGGQVALMAPTEILAEQHYKNAIKIFGGRLNCAILTGKTPQSERNVLLAKLAAGEPILLIGTHALIEDPVVFKNLLYVLVDEQHRFGVEQRRTLKKKGVRTDEKTKRLIYPHSLVLTATPIPRTLALTAYGDLAVSTLQELPPGRSPIKTHVVRERARKGQAYEFIRKELKEGHQAYFIFPLVNESEAEGFTNLKSAVAEAERMSSEVFPDFKVGLLHGQMKPDDKSKIMNQFQRNEIQILVSTTVVEVGVDVPNATVMAIEHAERFGLSQLHQLRGRVGRGGAQSYCFLFSHPRVGETTAERLEVLEETTDGFKIAEADLEIRGPGEFLGTRQAGDLPFRLANLIRDRDWLLKARDDAMDLLKVDPNLEAPENARLRRYFEREGSLQFDRLKTS